MLVFVNFFGDDIFCQIGTQQRLACLIHGIQFLKDIIINRQSFGIYLIKKFLPGSGFPPAEIKNQVCDDRNSHSSNSNNSGNNNRILEHGFQPPFVGLVFGNSIIPREGAFYNRCATGEAA